MTDVQTCIFNIRRITKSIVVGRVLKYTGLQSLVRCGNSSSLHLWARYWTPSCPWNIHLSGSVCRCLTKHLVIENNCCMFVCLIGWKKAYSKKCSNYSFTHEVPVYLQLLWQTVPSPQFEAWVCKTKGEGKVRSVKQRFLTESLLHLYKCHLALLRPLEGDPSRGWSDPQSSG